MKNKYVYITLLLLLPLLSCQKQDDEMVDDDNGPIINTCVSPEKATSDEPVQIFHSGPMEHGFFKATKINQPFEASPTCRYQRNNNLLNLNMSTYYEETFPDYLWALEDFIIENIPDSRGCYTDIISFQFANPGQNKDKIEVVYMEVDDDAIGEVYLLDTLAENVLEVDSITTDFIRGRFKMSFIKPDTTQSEHLPDRVRFFNGTFECAIIE